MQRVIGRRFIAVLAAALAVTLAGFPQPARAVDIGLNANIWIAWNSCYGTSGAASNLRYACDGSRDGSPLKLVISFELPTGSTSPADFSLSSTVAMLRVRTPNAERLPDYWRPQCRQAFTYTGFGTGVVNADYCAAWYQGIGNATNGAVMAVSVDPGSDRIEVQAASPGAISSSSAVTAPGGSKLAAGAILIETAPGDCAGCDQEVSFELESIRIDGDHRVLDVPSGLLLPATYVLTSSGPGTAVTWQGSATPSTPVRNRTWGAVKSLYR